MLGARHQVAADTHEATAALAGIEMRVVSHNKYTAGVNPETISVDQDYARKEVG